VSVIAIFRQLFDSADGAKEKATLAFQAFANCITDRRDPITPSDDQLGPGDDPLGPVIGRD